MEEVKGFFIIVGALGPIIALVVLIVVTFATITSISASARNYGDRRRRAR